MNEEALKTLGSELLKLHLEGLVAVLRSGEATAADRAVVLNTITKMGIQMVPKAGNAAAALQQAVTDTLPFAGDPAPGDSTGYYTHTPH